MALLQGAAPGTDIVLSEERMEGSRNFANKIWNAARLLFRSIESAGAGIWLPQSLGSFLPEASPDTLEIPAEDRWIFSRLNNAVEQANRAIEQYRYHEFAQVIWQFFWHEFCDWYLELKKLRFQEGSGLTIHLRNALAAFETALRMLHPAMPFLTEELWQRLAQGREDRPISIALAGFAQYRADLTDYPAEREIEYLQQVITMARNLRSESKLDPRQPLEGTLYSRTVALEAACKHAEAIRRLANVRLNFRAESAPPASVSAATRSTAEFDLVLQLPKSEQEAQRKRLAKEREQLAKNIENLERQLGNQAFLEKAPADVIEGMRKKLDEYRVQLRKMNAE
jgi:valyl-tRNA synthetase